MKNHSRPSKLEEVLAKNIPGDNSRELIVNPDSGFFDATNLAKALHRAAHGDTIILPPGEYPAFEIKKNIEVRCEQPGTVIIKGTIKAAMESCLLSGLELRSEPERPAVQLLKGTLVLDDCIIRGEITAGAAGAKTQLYLKNCLAGNALEGVTLTHQATVEISTSRISNCRVGLALRNGTSGAVYNSRVEACISTDEADPGIGVYAEQADFYCEGATFTGNGVGVYLKNCTDVRILGSLFHASETSALIAVAETAGNPLHLRSCVIDHQGSARCSQLSFTGGTASLAHCVIKPAPSPALTASKTRLEILNTRLAAIGEPAFEAQSCHLSGSGIFCESSGSASFAAVSCQGILRDSTFVGQLQTTLTDSPQLLLESCLLRETPTESSPAATESPEAETTIEGVLAHLKKFVAQESVRNDLEHILRLAHGSQLRKLKGLPVPEQNFHGIFMGPAGTGQLAAASALAHGLHAFGILNSSKIMEISLEEESGASPVGTAIREAGVVFLLAGEASGSAAHINAAQKIITEFVTSSRDVIILAGERDTLRTLLRANPVLDHAFRKTFYFSSYGPVELATQFARLCESDRIPLNAEAARYILLALHLFCERKDKRRANTKGIEILYEASRRRYLERCSLANRVDLELEVRDLDIPQDKTLRTAIERCPAFVTLCPACLKENPWLSGLESQCVCLHCDALYTASWGIWKDSSTYRRMQESLTQPLEFTMIASRVGKGAGR